MGRTVKPRARCPVCGRLGWISQFRNHHNFELVAHIYYGGKAKKDWIRTVPVTDLAMIRDMREFIAKKCLVSARQLGINMEIPSETDYSTVLIREYPIERNIPMEVEYGG
jgi:hypothetical protein